MTDLVALLRSAGLNVRDERVDPRPGPFAPIGVVNHHTATSGPALTSCKKGRADLAGPLCHVNITRQGVINVVCDGRANHAGKGSSVVAADVRAGRAITRDARDRSLADDTDGNTLFYGIEVDNDGIGEPLAGVQQDALVAVNATLIAHHKWSPNTCIHHRQWTRRKQDMRWRGDIPALVRFYLSPHLEEDVIEPRLVDIPPVNDKGFQWQGHDATGADLGPFHDDVIAKIRADDNGHPILADVQAYPFNGKLALSFFGLDGGPAPVRRVIVTLTHPPR